MWAGSIMPWVDPETVGPQKSCPITPGRSLVFAIPNIFLICAVLFALATTLRSMMAAYIGAVVLVMGYLITTSVVGQKIEYRDALAQWEPLGTGALRRGDALLDPERDEQPAGRAQRRAAVQPHLRDRRSACCSSASPCGASR